MSSDFGDDASTSDNEESSDSAEKGKGLLRESFTVIVTALVLSVLVRTFLNGMRGNVKP